MMKHRLYMAGPLFTFGEQWQNRELTNRLRELGYECFLPQETEDNLRKNPEAGLIFHSDVAGMDWADVIVACIDGPDPDSGTSWELGYMHAKGKPAILYRTDFRVGCGDFDEQAVNLMLTVPALEVITTTGGAMEKPQDAVQKLAFELHSSLQSEELASLLPRGGRHGPG